MAFSIDIKKAIMSASIGLEFKDNLEKLVVFSLLYKFIEQTLANGSSESNNVKTLAQSNISMYRTTVSNLNGQYISYKKMRDIAKESNVSNFVQFKQSTIDEIYNAYLNTSKLVPFSPLQFSQTTYGLSSLTYFQLKRLMKIHKEVMSPIAKYYSKKYGIAMSALQIESANEIANNPGKIIYFIIDGIENAKIIADISNNRIGIQYYSVSLSSDFVKLVTL